MILTQKDEIKDNAAKRDCKQKTNKQNNALLNNDDNDIKGSCYNDDNDNYKIVLMITLTITTTITEKTAKITTSVTNIIAMTAKMIMSTTRTIATTMNTNIIMR